ncbi:hypothetical protein NP233_g9355 [Leucocoprinus birnbaumii]|uniref:RING-type E3 ubiquitin transferase n=1 Tax=Leucocoprinus birnbaumii TaxID=56174 RepID=A0AAD5VR69_9AGAR|nr:hypothetical protein NP233_g9355 [Leucocoprinus birnbaumii]
MLRRQQRMREHLFMAHQIGQSSATLSRSSSSISSGSSLGGRVSFSQLERSPERPESTGYQMGRGDAEGLRDAIRVLRGDGLSVDRSLQFLDRYRQQRAEGGAPNVSEAERDANQEQRRVRDEARGLYVGMREREQDRQREGRGNLSVPRWLHHHEQSASASTSQMAGSSMARGATSRNTAGRPYPSWRHSWMSDANNDTASDEADMRRLQAFLESVSDSESDSPGIDEDSFMDTISLRPRRLTPAASPTSLSPASTTTSTTAIVGRNNDNHRQGRPIRQGRMTVDVRGNPISSGSAWSLRSSQAENGSTASGGGLSAAGRAMRDRMNRLRGHSMTSSPETPTGSGFMSGRRFVGGFARRFGEPGDYLDDDEFDASYESLLALQDALGEVKQRSTPEAVLKKLKKGKYREWAQQGAETRCPICLEDYELEDDVLKSGNCSHWMHKPCLETWFKRANTCPVCRVDVEPRPPASSTRGRLRRGYVPRFDRWRNTGASTNTAANPVNNNAGGSGGLVTSVASLIQGRRNSIVMSHPTAGGSEIISSSSSAARANAAGDSHDFEDGGNEDGGPGGSFF